jgi:hypothetical protein
LKERGKEDRQLLLSAIVVLLRNSTWRCGKLERSIVGNLHKRNVDFGGSGMSVTEMVKAFQLKGKRKSEFYDAIRRLERRNIVRVLMI